MRALMDEARATAAVSGRSPNDPRASAPTCSTSAASRRTLERWGDRFCRASSPTSSGARCEDQVNRAARYAKRFAAKEACAKALGTGFRERRLLARHGGGQPPLRQAVLRLTGGAAQRLAVLTPDGMRPAIELSLTDEYPFAHAIVVISAVPADGG